MSVNRLRIVVLGYIVRGPLGGLAWHHLQYVLGLVRLGHDVYFLEDSDDYPSCYDPTTNATTIDPTYGLAFISRVFDRMGLSGKWAYYDAHTERWAGQAAGRVLEVCANADMLINVSGVNPLRDWFERIPIRVLIDTDPVFMQVRHLQNSAAKEMASRHTAFLSFGENIGGLGIVPDDGFHWLPTRQPIVLDCWPVTTGPNDGKFTTVMQWESYASARYDGRTFGMKSMSFSPYQEMPRKTTARFELAIGRPPPELAELGWSLRDPLEVTKDPWTYQSFIMESKAEFSVAKHGYVISRSGWFSERSAAYLASGRPVVTQETGFSEWLEVGSGVLPFTTLGEAIAAIEDLDFRYDHHCRRAREIAADYFDARKVLPNLIERAMSSNS